MNGNRTPTTEHRQPIPLTACASLALLLVSGCRRETATVNLLTSLRDLTNVASFAEAPLGNAAMISTCDPSGGNADWARPRPLGPSSDLELAGLTGPGRVSRIWFTSLGVKEWLFCRKHIA